MAAAHDQKSGSLAEASETTAARREGRIDPLSDVLRTMRLNAALFFCIDASDPWCVSVPSAREFADIILPKAGHVISYHIAVDGRGIAALPDGDPVAFDAGDIIVFPHGDPYRMSSAPGVVPELNHEQTLQFFRDVAANSLPLVIPEGGGGMPGAKFICGFLGCEVSLYNPVFASLPRLLHVRRPEYGHTDLLDRLVDLALAEVQTERFGAKSIQLGLTELMFVEVLRRHLETMASEAPSWLAGLREPAVGRALTLLHAEPGRNWSIETLARESGASRSILAERFVRRVGETPMRYLTLWRMQIAARMLAEGGAKVAAVGEQVGFRSEAAFSRAFKRVTGHSPAAWRRQETGAAKDKRKP